MHLPARDLRTTAIVLALAAIAHSRPVLADGDDPPISAEVILEHVRFLAAEDLEGRKAGSPHERRAAEYIARRLEAAGVPAPPGKQRLDEFRLASRRSGERPTSVNVLGWIARGAGAAGPDGGVIVVGTHIDHLGKSGDEIYLGAEDNASGVAVILEVAAYLARRRGDLGRDVVFAFFGAEEIGLWGSRHFVASETVPERRIVAMINVDMIGRPLADQKGLALLKRLAKVDADNGLGVVGALERPLFVEVVDAAAAAAGLTPFGTRNLPLISSIVEAITKSRGDHAPFEAIGIPTLFFGSGESDDYHRPTDTIDKLRPDLMARRAHAIFETIVRLSNAPPERLPPRLNVRPPEGIENVKTLEIRHGDLRVILRDNTDSPEVLSGVQSLFNVRDAADFDAFDPDSAGASAGLNFEHIICGRRDSDNRFTPRFGRFDLYPLAGGNAAMLVRLRQDSPWDVGSSLRYEVAAPNAIDIAFRCIPYDRERFGPNGHASFFFANYMNDVGDTALHFLGVESDGGEERWIAADAPDGHPDWNRGGTYRHRGAAPLEIDADHDFRLNSWSYDWPRFTQPFYYGRAAHDMVLILLFDRGRTEVDEIRFSLFKFKLPRQPRPAWDFQYVVRRVEANREYGFRARLVWKKWVSAEDCRQEYLRFKDGL